MSLFSLKKKKMWKPSGFCMTWGDKEFEHCNVEGSLKGGKKKKNVEAFLCEKTESLKATHLPTLPSHLHSLLFCSNSCLSDFLPSFIREIIESSSGPRHLSTIPLKNFHLFKIAESVINLCLKNFLTNNFKQVKVF